jgi:hypothetical protein
VESCRIGGYLVAPMALDGEDCCQVLAVMHPVECFAWTYQDCWNKSLGVLFILLVSIGNASIVRLSIMFFIGSKF